ncbi:MAG: RHS repeat domain-containing protein [Bacteroidota bacterium]
MKTLTIYILITLCLCGVKGLGQSVHKLVQDVTMAAPNAASLGKFGDIPVSYFTGVPNIGIPIYTIQEGPLSLSIGLNYHASGIKVGETASWVGMGWSLSAGGMITRTTLGIPDDVSQGYLNKGKELLDPDFGTATDQRDDVADGALDSEPDLFNFNFGGYSGKFVLDTGGVVHLIPHMDLRVEYIRKESPSVRLIHRFIIYTPDGTKYVFGNLESESITDTSGIEVTTYDNIPSNAIVPTSWYLRQIISHDKAHTITLDYVEEKYGYASLGSCTQTYMNSGENQGPSCGPTDYPGTNIGIVNHQINGKRLSKITNSSNSVEISFSGNTDREDLDTYQTATGKRLDSIKIKTPITTLCPITFSFSYDYMQSPHGTDSEYKRLRLLSVREKNCNETKPPYTFDYLSGTLPFRMSKAIDHWGFHNGAPSNDSTLNIPDFVVTGWGVNSVFDPPFPPADRESNESRMKYGTLQKITYPTGGYNEFEYEANEVYNVSVDTGYTWSFSLSNCSYPNTASCCGITDTSTTFTFNSEQLDDAEYRMNIWHDVPTLMECTDQGEPGASVEILILNGTDTLGVQEFNTEAADTSITGILDSIAILSPDSSYTFILNVEDGKGEFSIFSESSFVVYNNLEVGGLRIKQITTHDGVSSSNDIVKTFEYVESEGSTNSSGKLYNEPIYYGFIEDFSGGQRGLVFQATSVVPLSSFNGYHIGYSRVVENTAGIGKTAYTFVNSEFNPNEIAQEYPYPPQQLRVREGKQDSVNTFKENGGTLSVISKSKEIRLVDPYRYLSGFIYKANKYADPTPGYPENYVIVWQEYQVRTAPYRVERQLSTLDGVQTSITYKYLSDSIPPHLFPIEITSVDSHGRSQITKNKYPLDYADTTSLGTGVTVAHFDSLYMIAPVIEQQVYEKDSSQSGDPKLLSSQVTTYQEVSGATQIKDQVLAPYKTYLLPTNTPLTYSDTAPFTEVLPSSLSFEERASYAYNSDGDITQQELTGGPPTSYLWAYNNNRPVAQIVGATYSEVLTELGSAEIGLTEATLSQLSDPIQLFTKLKILQDRMKQALITFYIYNDRLQLSKVTAPNGVSTSYEYDDFGRLRRTKDDDDELIQSIHYNYSSN